MKKTLILSAVSLALAATGSYATCTKTSNVTADDGVLVINSSGVDLDIYHSVVSTEDVDIIKAEKTNGTLLNYIMENATTPTYDLDPDTSLQSENGELILDEFYRFEPADETENGRSKRNVICATKSSTKDSRYVFLGCCVDGDNNFEEMTVRFTEGNTKVNMGKLKDTKNKKNKNKKKNKSDGNGHMNKARREV